MKRYRQTSSLAAMWHDTGLCCLLHDCCLACSQLLYTCCFCLGLLRSVCDLVQQLLDLCRVDFNTQTSAEGTDIPLIEAAKTFFASAGPSTWSITSMLLPQLVLPVVKLLAQAFPDKSMQRASSANHIVFDACNHLIEVCFAPCVNIQ